ncbi:MAG TPA: DUF4242 domain-containing protein [Chitinophagaceae bacterium]
MPKFIIERDIPGSGALTKSSLQQIARRSCEAIREIGPDIQWVQSYVTADKWYCVYIAKDESLVREHGKRGGFPVDDVLEVMAVVDPADAENIAELMR